MGTRWAAALAVSVLVLALVGTAVGTATAAWAQDGDPILVVPGGAVDGMIAMDPPMQVVQPGTALRWTIRNGGADVVLELTIVDITVDATGAVTPGARRLDLAPPSSSLTLREGEVGRVSVEVPADTPDGVIALVARTEDTDPEVEVAGIVAIGELPAADVSIARVDPADGVVVVDLSTAATTVVDVAVRVRAWPGVDAGTDTVRAVIVPAPGRQLRIDVTGSMIGRVDVDVVASPVDDAETVRRATASKWWFPRLLTGAVALVVLVLAAVAVLRTQRRSRPA